MSIPQHRKVPRIGMLGDLLDLDIVHGFEYTFWIDDRLVRELTISWNSISLLVHRW